MRRKILAHATIAAFIAAGLSIGSLSAQHGGQTGRNQSSSSSIAIAGLNGDNSVVQTSMAKLQAEASWGMSTIPLPNYLRNENLGLAPNQGLLVTQLLPGFSSANSGIEVGALILELDGVSVQSNQQLPMLNAEHKLMVMTHAGLKEICVKPMLESLPGAMNPWIGQDHVLDSAFGRVLPRIAARLGRTAQFGTGQPAPRSLAVSEVNGELTVSAIVDGANGPLRVELRGCHAEIVKQLAALPPEVQSQLAPHIGL
jgi:hypothetical protein